MNMAVASGPAGPVCDFLSDVHFLDLISGQTYTLDEMRMRKLGCRLCLAGNRSFGGIVRSLMAFERLLEQDICTSSQLPYPEGVKESQREVNLLQVVDLPNVLLMMIYVFRQSEVDLNM